MTRFEETIIQYKDNLDVYNFLCFVKDGLTSAQCNEALRIQSDEDFLQYLFCAFGCYSLVRNQGFPRLIRNPEALSLTPEQQKQLVELVRETIVSEIELAKAMKAAIKRPNSK